MNRSTRRDFLRRLGLTAAALPFLGGIPSLAAASGTAARRIVFLFSPNGIVPSAFWPDRAGAAYDLKPILAPLAAHRGRMTVIRGLCNRVRGDGDGHMRGIGCLLTGIELFPGSVQGGSDTPAGWAKGPSIDQAIRAHLQASGATRTPLGSLELGFGVPRQANVWNRWVYAGANQPLSPFNHPRDTFRHLYGGMKGKEDLVSVLDEARGDLATLARRLPAEDRATLDRHAEGLRALERQMAARASIRPLAVPSPPPIGLGGDNDDLPEIARLQADLLVSAFANDLARVASFQMTYSVSDVRPTWLGIPEGHHSLSHDPDLNKGSQEKLTRIDAWFAAQVAGLADRLAAAPDPSGHGSLLDSTTLIWTNELGKGNSHTHEDIPFVVVGAPLPGIPQGHSLRLAKTPHNRLLLNAANAFGMSLRSFGNPALCKDGPLG